MEDLVQRFLGITICICIGQAIGKDDNRTIGEDSKVALLVGVVPKSLNNLLKWLSNGWLPVGHRREPLWWLLWRLLLLKKSVHFYLR